MLCLAAVLAAIPAVVSFPSLLPFLLLLGLAAPAGGAPVFRRLSWGHWSAILLAAFFIYRFTFILRGVYLPALEEMQYWDWSRRLDWSYYSKPPLIAYLIRASCLVFGDTPVGIRFGGVLLSLLGSIVAWFFVRHLTGSPRAAFFSILMINLMPLFAVGSIVMTTDTPLMFFWAVAVYALYLAVVDDRRWAWWIFGVAFGLGMLSKYAMIYLLVCLVVFLVLSREHRRVLRRPEMYLSLLIGFLMFTPVIIWNIQHDWLTVRHVAGDAAVQEGFQIRPDSFFEYIGVQALLSNPVVHVFMWFFLWRAFRREGMALAPKWKYLVAMSVPVYALLLLKSLQGGVEGNWAAPAYFAWTIFAVAQFEQFWIEKQGTRAIPKLRKTAIAAIVLPIIGMGLLMERAVFNTIHDLADSVGISIRANMDPAYQFTGWRTLGRTTTQALAEMPDPGRTFILSWSYQVCAAVAFHGEGQPRTYGITIPERGQRLHQYTVWGGVDESKKGWDAISVNRGGGHQLDERVAGQFERVEGPFRIEVYSKGKLYRRFTYYKCFNFSGRIPDAVNLDTLEEHDDLRF